MEARKINGGVASCNVYVHSKEEYFELLQELFETWKEIISLTTCIFKDSNSKFRCFLTIFWNSKLIG